MVQPSAQEKVTPPSPTAFQKGAVPSSLFPSTEKYLFAERMVESKMDVSLFTLAH